LFPVLPFNLVARQRLISSFVSGEKVTGREKSPFCLSNLNYEVNMPDWLLRSGSRQVYSGQIRAPFMRPG